MTERQNSLLTENHLYGFPKTDFYQRTNSGLVSSAVRPIEISNRPVLDVPKGRIRWGGDWVDSARLSIVSVYGPPKYDFEAILASKHLTEGQKSELVRFLLTLRLWESTPGIKLISACDTWHRFINDPLGFTDYLDDYFALSWREEDFMESYNEVFPSRFLPRVRAGTDDLYTYSREYVQADDDSADLFRQQVKKLLCLVPDDLTLPSDGEIRMERSSTTSYVAEIKKTMPQWEASMFHFKTFFPETFEALRCIVPVYPGGVRDTIIADINANHFVRWLERCFSSILEFIPESAFGTRSSLFEKRKDEVVHCPGWHILPDIKKCGLTYNSRDLFSIVREELIEKFHDSRFERMKLFERIWVTDPHRENLRYHLERGYGLGMANHLVTFCNIAILYMALAIVPAETRAYSVNAIVGNDDADICIRSKRHSPKAKLAANSLMGTLLDCHENLGNKINWKKSTIQRFGLFFEDYDRDGFREKEALICNALACAYLAPDVRIAKNYIVSQSSRFTSEWAKTQLAHLAEFWGSEFFSVEDELNIHYEVGGWLDFRENGLKTTLVDLDFLLSKYSYLAVYRSNFILSKYIHPPHPRFKTDGEVDNFWYHGPAKKSDPRVQIFTLTLSDLYDYYREMTTWQRSFEKRMRNFKALTKIISYKAHDLYCEFLKRAWYQIPSSLVEREIDPVYHPYNLLEDYKVEINSEFRFDQDRSIPYLIEFGQSTPEDVLDPQIPSELIGLSLELDQNVVSLASQFSVTGVLPIYDYECRSEGKIPICKSIRKFREYVTPPERVGYSTREHRSLKFPLFKEIEVPAEDQVEEKSEDPKDPQASILALDELLGVHHKIINLPTPVKTSTEVRSQLADFKSHMNYDSENDRFILTTLQTEAELKRKLEAGPQKGKKSYLFMTETYGNEDQPEMEDFNDSVNHLFENDSETEPKLGN